MREVFDNIICGLACWFHRVVNALVEYHQEWSGRAKIDDCFFNTHLYYLKNYPIHCILPAIKWFFVAWLLTKCSIL